MLENKPPPTGTHLEPGHRLLEARTPAQVATLLTVVLEGQAKPAWHAANEARGPDLARTIRAMLEPQVPAPEPRQATLPRSEARLRQEWHRLIDRWEAIAAEAGDEEGDYAVQDAWWEPRYFGAAALSSDLDQVAAAMRPLVGPLFALEGEPEAFAEALEALHERIGAFLEWMTGTDGSLELGPAATDCVLHWEWLAAQTQENASAHLIRRLFKLKGTCPDIALNPDGLRAFFSTLATM